jgi:peptidoglycan/xylan/chitin deacetylase (PgdA/CDA1 family)
MRAERDGLPILLYHGIGSRLGQRFSVPEADFATHMDAVVASGRRAQTIGRLAAPRARGEPMAASAVAITFDDGTGDFYDHAWPMLRERGLPATLYVTSGLVGLRHEGMPMLGWEHLEELRDAGIEIGAHSHHHVALDVVSLERAARELVNSKLVLEDRLQVEITTFAYPFGYHTAAVRRLTPRAGYRSACAVKNALSSPYDDHLALARVTMTVDTTAARVDELLAGRGAPVAPGRELVRTRAWRLYRRARAISAPAAPDHSAASTAYTLRVSHTR